MVCVLWVDSSVDTSLDAHCTTLVPLFSWFSTLVTTSRKRSTVVGEWFGPRIRHVDNFTTLLSQNHVGPTGNY